MRATGRWTLVALMAVAVGCSAPRTMTGSPRVGADALPRLWTALATVGPMSEGGGQACNDAFGTYFPDFGVRGLACLANGERPLGQVAAAAGVPVFTSGPHALSAVASGGPVAGAPERLDLNLTSDEFGHYNPAFVAWAVETGIVGEKSAAVRVATQPVYNSFMQRLARVFWLTYGRLEAGGFPTTTPLGVEKDYARYLQGGPVDAGAVEYYPGFSMSVFSDANEALPGALGIDEDDLEWYSALYEANTATGFWLRRREDGTLEAFHDGLRRLLATYDATWLAAQG